MIQGKRPVFSGGFSIAPTPFLDGGELDLDGQRRVLDCMVEQGVDGICTLANYSEQFTLSDRERDTLLDLCVTHVAGRVPVIATCTCSLFSTRLVKERARRAEAAGAGMIMAMPPYHGATLRPDDTGVAEHFLEVAEAVSLPVKIQDAPLSGVTLPVPLLARLARDADNISYFKIEVPGAAMKLRALIEAAGDAVERPFDGEESVTLLADLDAGATGTMPSALLPDLIKPVLQHFRTGRREHAEAQYTRILPLINYENRQCGLRATTATMAEEGCDSERRCPSPPRPAASRDPGRVAGVGLQIGTGGPEVEQVIEGIPPVTVSHEATSCPA